MREGVIFSCLELFRSKIKFLILIAPASTPERCKDDAIHPSIGLYYTLETISKTETRFKPTHPLRGFDALGFRFQVLVGLGKCLGVQPLQCSSIIP